MATQLQIIQPEDDAPLPDPLVLPSGDPVAYALLLADGTTVLANSRTGIVAAVIPDYHQFVQMAELVEADGADALFANEQHGPLAEQIVPDDVSEDTEVLDVLWTVLAELRTEFLAGLADDYQSGVVIGLTEALEEGGSGLDQLHESDLTALLSSRAETTVDFEGRPWTLPVELYLLTTDYFPATDDPEAPQPPARGENVVWLDPTDETTLITSLAVVGMGNLYVIDTDDDADE